ncbi:hypothetical protein ACFSRY_09995 [Pontibacter locisalis]|uniref:Uncharacterized protein n=1 Tax=Pontibacter locisalis TaxID=1719035 RepID=A0ABW5IL81_9BACT
MELVVDKGFLDGFFQFNSSAEKRAVYDSFIQFVKSIRRGLKVVCNFSDYSELEFYLESNALLQAIEEREPQYTLEAQLSGIVKGASFYQQGSCFKMFFIGSDCNECDQLEKQVGFSFINAAELEKKWSRFLTSKEILRYQITNNPEIAADERFDSWRKLRDYKHPINAIVVADRYILCDKYEQKIQCNLKPLLLELIPDRKTIIPVDLTIIASQKDSKHSFESIKTDLDTYFEECIPSVQVNLTIIDFDDELKALIENQHGTDFHDRRIVTTYYWYEIGKGFNLFKYRDQLKPSSSKLYMGFNLYSSNQDDVKLLLEEYAACASMAKNVFGSNKNRLLLPYQFMYQTTQPEATVA